MTSQPTAPDEYKYFLMGMMSLAVGICTYNNINTVWWIPVVDFKGPLPLNNTL